MSYVLAALGLAVLMVIHEGGHYLAARRFGMRVLKFSIGFGPAIWRHKPKGSPTTYQIAIIPFLAYVQIAGMNPYEDIDPKDKGSYANASLWGRIVTIAAGPLANYLFASVFLFSGYMLAGRRVLDEHSMRVSVIPGGPAAQAEMRSGDRIVSINGEPIPDWTALKRSVSGHAGEPLDIVVEREESGTKRELHLPVTPGPKGEKTEGKIMIEAAAKVQKVSIGEAALLSVTEPPRVVADLAMALARIVTLKEKPQFSGPVYIVKETAAQVRSGIGETLRTLGILSAYIGGFNLLPVPALDGGRLLFLLFEAASRRRADAKIEAQVHAVGLLMMLTLIAFVTYSDLTK